jgi:arginyl-tRNA synthetase
LQFGRAFYTITTKELPNIMTAEQLFTQKIAALLSEKVEMTVAPTEIVYTPDLKMGDFSFPCFTIAKAQSQNPAQIAQELAEKLAGDETFADVRAMGPYLNFWLNKAAWNQSVLIDQPITEPLTADYNVLLEYSGPNPCKTFHIGHFRNTILGSSLINLYRHLGYTVMPVNYLNDTGTHVAKVLWLYLRSYQGQEPTENQGAWLGALYVEANNLLTEEKEQGADQPLLDEVKDIHRRVEAGDEQLTQLLEQFKAWSLEEFDRIYNDLDAEFEHIFYDSDYIDTGKDFVQELLDKKIAQHSDGAVIVDLEEHGLHTTVVLKSDGTALYLTKDLAMARDRFKKYDVNRLVYVVGAEQILHFKQVFKILELYGFERAKDCVHLAYELVNTASGQKMSTRAGTVVLYNDLYQQAFDRLYQETKERHADWAEEEIAETAQAVALAALKFDMLKQDAQKRINFDMNKALDISGDTGPYLLYTLVRIGSLLDKAQKQAGDLAQADVAQLVATEEQELIRKIAQAQATVVQAATINKPSVVAHYALDLARAINHFYHQAPILNDEDTSRQAARVLLLQKAQEALQNMCEFMNIRTVTKM